MFKSHLKSLLLYYYYYYCGYKCPGEHVEVGGRLQGWLSFSVGVLTITRPLGLFGKSFPAVHLAGPRLSSHHCLEPRAQLDRVPV